MVALARGQGLIIGDQMEVPPSEAACSSVALSEAATTSLRTSSRLRGWVEGARRAEHTTTTCSRALDETRRETLAGRRAARRL